MQPFLRNIFLLISFFALTVGAIAQEASGEETPKPDNDTPRPTATSRIKPYHEVITDETVTDEGLFKVHRSGDKYYFEIPDSLFKREMLVVNRVSKAPSGSRSGSISYHGDQISQKIVWFEKGPGNKVFVRTIYHTEQAQDSTSVMFEAVSKSNVFPISTTFNILAVREDSTGYVIDVTSMVNGDNDLFFLNNTAKSGARLGALQADKSYVVDVRPFPINVEVTAVKTYARLSTPPSTGSPGNLTVELNSSLVLLPKEPMQARYNDLRMGYFDVSYTDFDLNIQGVRRVSMIKRWRLEPRLEDVQRYMAGELVEPAKPIVFYIDPATPEKWVPYLIQGVNDWQHAFEQAGFKNAIFGKRAPTPEENPEWSLKDARHSAIVYKASTKQNASGPSTADPRSGEIIESHINWYHNVMSLLRRWYMIQAGPNDPRARSMTFDDELMGELIRYVSAHEVGHALGLRHNFFANSTVPVEKLRDRHWVETHGHTPSIMDYARFNYVAQPEDSVGFSGIIGRIGVYDEWAINWGYRRFPQYRSPEEEKEHLNHWIIENLEKDKRLWFGEGEFYKFDPRNNAEQIGDDAIKGSHYGILNLKRVIENLVEWTRQPNEGYDGLSEMYREVFSQFNRYNGHVFSWIGGIYRTPKTVEQTGPVFEPVPAAIQKEAIAHLNEVVFKTPEWILNREILQYTGLNGLRSMAGVHEHALNGILNRSKLDRLVQAEVISANNYSVVELLDDLKRGVWTELQGRKPVDLYRRQLQQLYIKKMDELLNPVQERQAGSIRELLETIFTPSDPDLVDVTSSLRAHLIYLQSDIDKASKGHRDRASRVHLQDMSRRIEQALKP